MRIVCQKCAAAYAIDDRLITAKGVRAQCPRCRNLQLVRRDPSAVPSQDAPAAPSRPAAAAASAPPPADDLFGDFGAPAPMPAAQAPAVPARPAKAAAPEADLFGDFGAMPEPSPSSAPPVDPFADLGGPAPAPSAGADPLLDFLGPAPTSPPAPVARISSEPGAVPVSVAPIPDVIQTVLPRWKLKYLELEGTSTQRLEEGRRQLAREERSAYTEAEESFQQALLLDPRSDEAIAGYVQSLALGRGAGLDDTAFKEAIELVEAAQSRAGRVPQLLLAEANLLLTRSRQSAPRERARVLAEESLAHAKATDAQKAEAHLVMGRVYLSSSGGLADQQFGMAQKLAPDLKRIQYYRALAHESAGEYKLALETLRKRLTADPRDWDSLAATSRIYQEVGEPQEARKLYEARAKADPGELRALLPLAVLRYQAEGNAAAGVRELRALLKTRERHDHRDVAQVLVHLAAAERAAGNSDAGVKAAEEALGLSKELPEAHLQVFLVALEQRDAARARKHLDGIKGRLEDRALEAVLEGRLLLLEKKPLEALERFQAATSLDARRLDAQLLAGVAEAAAKRSTEAFRVLKQALAADPLRLEPRPVSTRFWLRPAETVKGVEGTILALAQNPDDPAPSLYEGVLRFHQGDLDAADRHLRDVLESDANNADALAYRSLIATRKGNSTEARALSARAVSAGRQHPVAHLAHGWALADGRQVEPAKRALRDALGLSPTLWSARVRLAELESTQRRAEARKELVSVVGLDPEYLPAKRMLYLLDR
ncbi:zinc-ribbon domain-containing protein [Myxococcus sp. AB025B]|uniref:zinc-ribbon domain-containing protein n=1 Tax=Myxococcus sp. AB025B TaxID=2562794 RepID=UPI0011419EEF|nr:zinc-ribbon domain-containing protein [Myxococcus sp. AB025B]